MVRVHIIVQSSKSVRFRNSLNLGIPLQDGEFSSSRGWGSRLFAAQYLGFHD
jgi:hypothetical protein